jgi:hypothetical protein
MAAERRGHMKTALQFYKNNDVRHIDGAAYVRSGGFNLKEI